MTGVRSSSADLDPVDAEIVCNGRGRYDLGPGLGYKLLNRTNLLLNAGLGANYQVQDFSNGTETRLFYDRIAENLNWKINSKFTWDERFEFFPQAERFDRYRFRFETNLRYLLMQNLSLILTAIDIYDSLPAPSVSPNDFLLRSAIGVHF